MAKIDKRDHTYLGENKFKFNCPCNFILVTEEFMNIISENFKNHIEEQFVKEYVYEIIIGGECIIMRNYGDTLGRKPYSYLIIFQGNDKDLVYNIDYILIIDDKNEREEAQNFILKYNIWNYFKKINFSIKDEYKEIINKEKGKIGFIVRNGELKRKEQLKNIQQEKIKFKNSEILPKFISILVSLYTLKDFINE